MRWERKKRSSNQRLHHDALSCAGEPRSHERITDDFKRESNIDLNAVRAGLVSAPKDYRYCGYGEACGGSRQAREGIGGIFAHYGHDEAQWQAIGGQYRLQLFERGEKTASRAGVSREAVTAVLESDGTL